MGNPCVAIQQLAFVVFGSSAAPTEAPRREPFYGILRVARGHDICMLQKVDLDERHVNRLTAQAKSAGYYLLFGQPTSFGDKSGRVGRRVAILSRHVLLCTTPDIDGLDRTCDYLLNSGRWIEAAVDFGGGRLLNVAALYGVAGASGCCAKKEFTQKLHAAALVGLAAFKTSAYVCGADCNILPESLAAVAHAKQMDVAHDVLVDSFPGKAAPNRFCRGGVYAGMSGDRISRIDAMFINRPAAACAFKFGLRYMDAVGMDHVPLQLLLRSAIATDPIDIAVQPRVIKLPDRASMTAKEVKDVERRSQEVFDEIAKVYTADFRDALQAKNIDRADYHWHTILEKWLIKMFGAVQDFRVDTPPRGKPLPIRTVKLTEAWSRGLEQTKAVANCKAEKLLGAIKDLRARLRRWIRVTSDGEQVDDTVVEFCVARIALTLHITPGSNPQTFMQAPAL